jgi:hypothetical protein
MSQRRKEDEEWVWSIGRLVALLLTMALVYPPFRQNIPPTGVVFLVMLVSLLVLGGVTKLVRSAWSTASRGGSANPLQSTFWTPPAAVTYLPQSTYELLRQMREGDAALTDKLLELVYQKLDYRVRRRADMALVIERGGVTSGLQYAGPTQGKAGVKAVRTFRDALTAAQLDKGILIASEGFTRQAKKLAGTCGIELLDETDLTRLLDATRAGHDTTILAALPNSRLAPVPQGNNLPALTAVESR